MESKEIEIEQMAEVKKKVPVRSFFKSIGIFTVKFSYLALLISCLLLLYYSNKHLLFLLQNELTLNEKMFLLAIFVAILTTLGQWISASLKALFKKEVKK